MDLESGRHYHLYNRSNNGELLFKSEENYKYFLRNFKKRFSNLLCVLSYCLMPTHFHFLVQVETENIQNLKQKIGIQLSAYTKANNNVYDRTGSLFQQHTKAKLIDDRSYLLTVMSYIHQNPIRSELVEDLESWPFSSYPDLAGFREGTLVDHSFIKDNFTSLKEFRDFSNRTISQIDNQYWIDS